MARAGKRESGENQRGEKQRRRLTMRFATLVGFQEEFRRNIANGGVYIQTDLDLGLREPIEVELDLLFCGEQILIEGEVVTRITPEALPEGGVPGVAVQLAEPTPSLRSRFARIVRLPRQPGFRPTPGHPVDRRTATRKPAKVSARLQGSERKVEGHTRNISAAGALLSLDGPTLPTGSSLRLSLMHPTRDEEIEIVGTVVRHEDDDAGGNSLAIRFDSTDTASTARRFIASLQSDERSTPDDLIRGPFQGLGLPNLVQMFSSCADAGTLRVRRGSEQAVVAFEGGTLYYAILGQATGPKALARLFTWREGTFEFDTRVEPREDLGDPIPIYGVVMEALQQVDELARLDTSAFPPGARLEVEPTSLPTDADEIGKLERAVVDVVWAGDASVRSVLDALPEFDAEIYRALEALRECSALRILP